MLHFELVTPDRVLYKEEIRGVTLPTTEGEITVLPGHAPLVATLVAGIAKVQKEGAEEELAVSGGFIEIQPGNTVRVLADTAERGTELELSVIETAKIRAEQVMKETSRSNDVQYAHAAAALERELARYHVARRHASRK